ncbi:hypothetical protein SKAU_G00426320 [Synaphobranchus kaupii]|uniref:Uncharacterized protein n=1 Tax=Synaphobranchus kaupii TaxID=118154 RepID=A0A9Q1IAH4_SYNKA|nr:hypothetical protein SKAU_G00426320 [Synaphobranchus kaupii]
MSEPNNEKIRTACGSPLNKSCRVHVPGSGFQTVVVSWWRQKEGEDELISFTASDRVHQASRTKKVENGEELEQLLHFTKVNEEDFSSTYVCRVSSDKGQLNGNFTLQQPDPDLRAHSALVFVVLVLLFTMGTATFTLLKIDMALWCRGTFPHLYPKPGADGKAYDAYVVYPGMCAAGSSGQNEGQSRGEVFALHTLPLVLEKHCGYKLFIYGRDSLPGEAMVDSIRENITKSSHFLLLYTASTFCKRGGAGGMARTDGHLLFAQQMGVHCALVEETLRVLLVELEEVTDYSAFPESLLHLRRKQGALQWWRLGGAGGGAGEMQLRPSSRFWKQVRYHMPPRGRSEAYLEKEGTLLNV